MAMNKSLRTTALIIGLASVAIGTWLLDRQSLILGFLLLLCFHLGTVRNG